MSDAYYCRECTLEVRRASEQGSGRVRVEASGREGGGTKLQLKYFRLWRVDRVQNINVYELVSSRDSY